MVAWIWPRTCSGGGDAEASTDEVASAEGSGCAVGRDATAGREAVTCADGVADVPVVWAAGEVRNWVSITAATATPAPPAPRASIPPRVRPARPRRRTRGSADPRPVAPDRKSTRLNSSHQIISYAVFCLKKKKKYNARGKAAS